MTKVSNVSALTNTASKNKPSRPEQYVVKSGDTLSSVAKKYGMSVEKFKSWTGLTSSSLKVGQKIPLPMDTVPSGKGIYALAKKYGMSVTEFCKLNNIPQSYDKYVPSASEKFYVIDKNKKSESANVQPKVYSAQQKMPEIQPQKTKKEQQADTDKEQKPICRTANDTDNKRKWGSSFTPDELAKELHKAVDNNIAAVGKPVFDSLLKEINLKNVDEVIKAYDNLKTKESLLNAITSEIGSDKQKRKDAVMHIYDALAKKYHVSSSVRESFVKELDEQFNSFGMVNTKKMDKTLARMTESPKELAKEFQQVFKQWGAVGRHDFDELLQMVNPRNVEDVILAYDNLNTGKSLTNAITSEIKSDKQDRKNAVMSIFNTLCERKNVTPELKEQFKKILDNEFNSSGMVNTKELDNIIKMIIDEEKDSSDEIVYEYIFSGKPVKATGKDLVKQAQKSAANDPAFKGKNFSPENFERPLPFINADNKIEAASKLYLPDEKHADGPMKGKVVILNAGHGGYCPSTGAFDAGTVGTAKNASGKNIPVEEWKVADTYIKKLAKKLNDKGATVVFVSGPVKKGTGGMFETQYLENLLKGQRGSARIRNIFKNTPKSDMAFLSVHVESAKNNPDEKKCTVRANQDKGDKVLAESICKYSQGHNLCPSIEINDYYVTKAMGDEIPAVLVELGNIANDDVIKSLFSSKDGDSYTDALAAALQEVLLNKD